MNRTLIDLFRPRPDLVGQAGILCAFSATADFLEVAASTFTRLAPRRRESFGRAFMFLMLDGHTTPERRGVLKPNEVPGLLELPPRAARHRDLLHAKVGLLQFGKGRSGAASLIRVIVSTGNWTQASARRQLELAWQLDVEVKDGVPQGPWLDRADLHESATLLRALQSRFAIAPEVVAMMDPILSLAEAAPSDRKSKRFIHTLQATGERRRTTPIYEHLVSKAPHDKENSRDLIICGAGFYEHASKKGAKPEVLAKLEALPGVRAGARFALARPSDAGAIAGWKAADDGWTIIGAVDELAERRSGAARSLHAKFVFVGRKWGASARDGWLYLGSGNLTRRGLLLAPESDARGNVEAGVILGVRETLNADALRAALFTDMNADALEHAELSSGHDDEDDILDNVVIDAPPVLLVREEIDGDGSRWLRPTWNDDAGPETVTFRWLGGELEVARGTTRIPAPAGPCPSTLTISFNGVEAVVPVMDARGGLCRVALLKATFDDALADILNFPVPPADDETDDDDDENDGDGPAPPDARQRSRADDERLSYPLQEAMDLIEGVSALQVLLPAEQLLDWFAHLETRLLERFSDERLRGWRSLEFSPLDTLAKDGFRPKGMTVDVERAYTAMLRRVAAAWGFAR